MIKFTAVAAAAIGLAAASAAQTAFETPTNLALRLGIGFPTDDRTQNFLDDPLTGFGLDYFLQRGLISGANGEAVITIDWLTKGLKGNQGYFLPITINQRWYDNSKYSGLGDPRSYYSLGAGVAYADITGADSAIALRGAYGYEFSTNIFAEAAFTYLGDTSSFNGTNVAVYIGYRF
jgi:hypothetical protein